MITTSVESGVDIVLVKEDLVAWVTDAHVPDVCPVAFLRSGEGRGGYIGVVPFIHLVVQRTRVPIGVDVGRRIDDNPSLPFSEEEADR